jgi:hypothetical protein
LKDVLPRLKLLNALTAVMPPAVTLVRSFPGKGMYFHEPVQGLNLHQPSITRLETEMPVTSRTILSILILLFSMHQEAYFPDFRIYIPGGLIILNSPL